MRSSAHQSSRRNGFTLLELVLAMLVMALLMGMIFSTATANLQLSNTVVERQNEESVKTAFFQLLSHQFSTLPGNTRMELKSNDAGNHYLSDLTLQNVPLTFVWSGTEKVAKAVQLSTVQKRDGYLDIVLRYYEDEILQDSTNANTATSIKAEPFAEVVLLEGVRTFEWRVLDGRTMEWNYDWDLVGRLPLQMELTIAFGAEGDFIRQIFWITPKQDPEVMMRQLQQTGGGGQQGGGGGIQLNPNDPNNPTGPRGPRDPNNPNGPRGPRNTNNPTGPRQPRPTR